MRPEDENSEITQRQFEEKLQKDQALNQKKIEKLEQELGALRQIRPFLAFLYVPILVFFLPHSLFVVRDHAISVINVIMLLGIVAVAVAVNVWAVKDNPRSRIRVGLLIVGSMAVSTSMWFNMLTDQAWWSQFALEVGAGLFLTGLADHVLEHWEDDKRWFTPSSKTALAGGLSAVVVSFIVSRLSYELSDFPSSEWVSGVFLEFGVAGVLASFAGYLARRWLRDRSGASRS